MLLPHVVIKSYWIILSGTSWKCPNGETIGFIYLDNVNGERVLIQTQGSPDGKDYKFIVEESQKVLDYRRVFKTSRRSEHHILIQDVQSAHERQVRR